MLCSCANACCQGLFCIGILSRVLGLIQKGFYQKLTNYLIHYTVPSAETLSAEREALMPTKTQEALEIWKRGDKYLDDPDPGRSDPHEVFADANRVIQLAKMENVALEDLVPDQVKRERLLEHAKAFNDLVDDCFL